MKPGGMDIESLLSDVESGPAGLAGPPPPPKPPGSTKSPKSKSAAVPPVPTSAAPVPAPVPIERASQEFSLDPSLITPNEANEKARPTERPEQRRERVLCMAESIARNGQKLPVLVVAVADEDDPRMSHYEYVDGGCRVEAIALLSEQTGRALQVRCLLVPPGADLFRTAAVTNLHRTQNSVLDVAHMCQEAQERNGWHSVNGRPPVKRIAEYLGLSEARVSEHLRVLHAPAAIRAMLEQGVIANIDVAMRLIRGGTEAEQVWLAERAAEIAESEQGPVPEPDPKEVVPSVEPVSSRIGPSAGFCGPVDAPSPAGPPPMEKKAKAKVERGRGRGGERAKVRERHVDAAKREAAGEPAPAPAAPAPAPPEPEPATARPDERRLLHILAHRREFALKIKNKEVRQAFLQLCAEVEATHAKTTD